jgi:hypothetical protein
VRHYGWSENVKAEFNTLILFMSAIYETLLAAVTYGAGSWPLTTKHENTIIATEMKFLRRTAGKTRRDKWRNNRIRETLNQEPMLNYTERRSIQLYGRVIKNAGL